MGQRLVIKAYIDDVQIASIYYHWSAYTQSAFWELIKLRDFFNNKPVTDDTKIYTTTDTKDNPSCQSVQFVKMTSNPSELAKIKDIRLRLIRFLESLGGGVWENDLEFVEEIYPLETFKHDPCRDSGMIALSEKGMEDLEQWAEGFAAIDFAQKKVWNEAVWYIPDDELEEHELDLDKLPDMQYDFIGDGMNWDDIEKASDSLKTDPYQVYSDFNGSQVFTTIE